MKGLIGLLACWLLALSLSAQPTPCFAQGPGPFDGPGGFGQEFGPPGRGPNPQMDETAIIAIAAVYGVILLGVLLFAIAVSVVIILLISTPLKAIPDEYREMEPGKVWLLLIPLFNIVWNFFVFTRVPKSFQNYFAAQGKNDFGDCGEKLGMWYAICVACFIIPCVNYIAGPASLVLVIIFLVKIWDLKKQLPA
jgi:hypothetical protein